MILGSEHHWKIQKSSSDFLSPDTYIGKTILRFLFQGVELHKDMLRILHGELSVSLLTGFLLFRVKGTRSKSTVPNTLFPLQLSSEMHSKCFGIVSYEAIFTISSLICFRLHLPHQSKQIFRNRSNAENLWEINCSGAALDLALGAAAIIFYNTGFTTRKTTDFLTLCS